jgi:hypothetical protein
VEPGNAVKALKPKPGRPIKGAVSVSINHGAKTIDISVRLGFWAITTVPPSLILSIIGELKQKWDRKKYLCYTTTLQIDAEIFNTLTDVPDDRIDIELDFRPSYISNVWTLSGDNPLSDSSSQSLEPIRGSWAEHSTWNGNPAAGGYGHELGHILGLDDGYVKSLGQPRVPGHSSDMMFRSSGCLSAEMVTRLLRRHGLNPGAIKCPMDFDTTPCSINYFLVELDDIQVHAHCDSYDPPSDDPAQQPAPMQFRGTMHILAGYLAGEDLGAARLALKELLGIDTNPLAPYYEISESVSFTLPPATSGDKNLGLGTTFYIPLKGSAAITGQYAWSTVQNGQPCRFGPPFCNGPLLVFDMRSDGIFPGPAMYGMFSFP